MAWLNRADPAAQLFATPGDLLVLCALAHRTRADALDVEFSPDLAAMHLRRMFEQADPRLEASGSEIVRRLVAARLSDVTLPWSGGLDYREWARLAGRQTDIESVAGARVLRAHGGGRWNLHPRWVVSQFAQECVGEALRKGKPRTWGMWSIDPERRPLLDSQTDLLDWQKLRRAIMRAVKDFDTNVLGSVAAVEALFASLGGKPERAAKVDTSAVEELWSAQRQVIWRTGDDRCPTPLTRPTPTRSEGADWFCNCWSLSFVVKRPLGVPDDLAWLFPGWSEISLKSAPPWLERLPIEGNEAERFQELAAKAVAKCLDQRLGRVRGPLRMAVMIASVEKGWDVRRHLQALPTHALSTRFVARARQLPVTLQAKLASEIWSAVSERGDAGQTVRQLRRSPELAEFVLAALPPEEFVREIGAPMPRAVAETLGLLPDRLRGPVLHWCIEYLPQAAESFLWHTDDLSGDAIAPLEKLCVRSSSPNLATRTLWRVAPERALELTCDAVEANREAATWFQESPADSLAELLKLLESATTLEAWAADWLRERLPRAGPHAERVYRLLKGMI